MLLGNYNVIHKSPGKFLGGVGAICDNNWGKNGQRMAIYTESSIPDQWGLPVGYSGWMLPRKAGYVVAFSEMSLTGSGNAVMGVNGDGVCNVSLLATADLSLVVSSTGICNIVLTVSGDAVGALYANGSANIDLTATGTLGAVAFSTGISTVTLTATADIKALGYMAGTMSPFTELSPEGLASAVWNSLANEYNTLGTMGAKLNTASSGGVDLDALAQAVWEYGIRSLSTSGNSAIADAVWDEPLTGATHNVPTSAGRRVRQLGQIVVWDGIAQGSGTGDNQIQLDTGSANYDGAYDPTEIAIVAGTGVGQSRMILDYVGSTRIATVDRNWKVKPDATSEFIIYVNSGREHVNEGLATGGTANTITLNSSASSITDAYVGQNVFIRSGTGQDQVARVTAYNGTTKVATIETAMAGGAWGITPDTTSGYVMLPYHAVAGGTGGGATAQEVWEYATKPLIVNLGDISKIL